MNGINQGVPDGQENDTVMTETNQGVPDGQEKNTVMTETNQGVPDGEIVLSDAEIEEGRKYSFRKATAEVKKFSKKI